MLSLCWNFCHWLSVTNIASKWYFHVSVTKCCRQPYNDKHRSLIMVWIHKTQWPPFRRQHFQMHFFNEYVWNLIILEYIIISEVCAHQSYWQWANIHLYNGLVPKRQKAINWTNDDLVCWSTYASFGLNELSSWWWCWWCRSGSVESRGFWSIAAEPSWFHNPRFIIYINMVFKPTTKIA